MPHMIDEFTLALLWVAWLSLSTMPVGFMLGASCSPCCGPAACGVADGKPRTDPKNEGTWVPSGTWRGVGGVTWSFTSNPGDDSGETWFFYGSQATSKAGGNASLAEQRDWGNICNWYSNKTTSPSSRTSLTTVLDKRATRLPPTTAIVHVYSNLSTATAGPLTAKTIYFWNVDLVDASSQITTTASAHDSPGGAVFFDSRFSSSAITGTVNNGATFVGGNMVNQGVINGGAVFNTETSNRAGTVNGGAVFNENSLNGGTVNGGATFNDDSTNTFGTVNDGAIFNDNSIGGGSSVTNGGAVFNDSSSNGGQIVNGGATFNNSSANRSGTVNGGATFNDSSKNGAPSFPGTVNGGATFNDSSENSVDGTVNGGATFNDAACSRRTVGDFFATPCTLRFVAHPTDIPVCNGTAPKACVNPSCGCD